MQGLALCLFHGVLVNRAAIIKNHKLTSLNNRNLLFYSSGSCNSKINVPSWLVSGETSLPCRWLPSHCVLTWPFLCQTFFFYYSLLSVLWLLNIEKRVDLDDSALPELIKLGMLGEREGLPSRTYGASKEVLPAPLTQLLRWPAAVSTQDQALRPCSALQCSTFATRDSRNPPPALQTCPPSSPLTYLSRSRISPFRAVPCPLQLIPPTWLPPSTPADSSLALRAVPSHSSAGGGWGTSPSPLAFCSHLYLHLHLVCRPGGLRSLHLNPWPHPAQAGTLPRELTVLPHCHALSGPHCHALAPSPQQA